MRNLVVTGFMGTGKTSVGRIAAARLGLRFVDMDEVIEARAGMAISEMFTRFGEETFRQTETALCCELGAGEGMTIATGGGTMMRAENREALGAKGLIVCLTCEPDEILRRIEGDATRPMLYAPDKRARTVELLAIRMPVYLTLPAIVDTTARSIEEVAALVVRAYQDGQCNDLTST